MRVNPTDALALGFEHAAGMAKGGNQICPQSLVSPLDHREAVGLVEKRFEAADLSRIVIKPGAAERGITTASRVDQVVAGWLRKAFEPAQQGLDLGLLRTL